MGRYNAGARAESGMFEPKIRLDKNLYDKLKKCADEAGYPSVDTFIQHVLEKTASSIERDTSDEEAVTRQLQGLGYIDE
jgi:hypothetical protein